jgi:hypothetical protein
VRGSSEGTVSASGACEYSRSRPRERRAALARLPRSEGAARLEKNQKNKYCSFTPRTSIVLCGWTNWSDATLFVTVIGSDSLKRKPST